MWVKLYFCCYTLPHNLPPKRCRRLVMVSEISSNIHNFTVCAIWCGSAECMSKLKGQFAWIPYCYKPQKPQQQYHQRDAAGNQMHINSRLRPTNRITFAINTKWQNLYKCTQINYKLLYVCSFVHCMWCALLWCNIRAGEFLEW